MQRVLHVRSEVLLATVGVASPGWVSLSELFFPKFFLVKVLYHNNRKPN